MIVCCTNAEKGKKKEGIFNIKENLKYDKYIDMIYCFGSHTILDQALVFGFVRQRKLRK